MNKLQIIDETVEFYQNNPRAIYKDQCCYDNNGIRCAVGRCMVEEAFEDVNIICNVGVERISNLDKHLKPEYQGHDIDFWQMLQHFHDTAFYWEGQKLSELGERFIKELKENET